MHYQTERTSGCRISDSWTYRGLKAVVMENELLRVTVLADKGADIFEFVHKPSDTDFMWRTPWGVRDPSLFIPSSGWGEGVWHDMYEGGWQTIAPTGGYPGEYMGAEIGQHNESALMPWDCQILTDTPEQVSAKFWVQSYRTPYWIEKTLTIEQGSAALKVSESVTNLAEEPTECVWGQHIALGEPFLNAGCRLDLPGGSVYGLGDGSMPGSLLAAEARGEWPTAPAPGGDPVDLHKFPARSERIEDMAVFHELADGWYAVTDPNKGVGFGFAFPKSIFEYIWYWQVFGGKGGYPWYKRTYNVGLEPFSSMPSGLPLPPSEEKTSFTMEAGETRTAEMVAVAYESTSGVESISPDGAVTVSGG